MNTFDVIERIYDFLCGRLCLRINVRFLNRLSKLADRIRVQQMLSQLELHSSEIVYLVPFLCQFIQ